MISATVSNTPISVSVPESGISVGLPASQQVSATVSGGIGPQGFTQLSAATDVEFSGASTGDVLRYSNGKWRNYREESLVDGGNF